MSAVLALDDVWKGYPRWQPTGAHAAAHRRMRLLARRGEQRWALAGVTLRIQAGEAVAVVGHNGAGKSTLLRLAAGVGWPSRGRVSRPDGTAALLSLGSALDLRLTGRENAETIAAILGLEAREARRVVAAAIAFAELEEFETAPVRVYSDGMRLRLVFGVLAQVQPRLLVVDEALAVGDAGFQRRCLDRVAEMREAGAALLLATHDLHQAIAETDRAVWLHRGRVRADGEPVATVTAYREAGRAETLARTPSDGGDPELGVTRWGSQELRIEDVRVLGASPAGPVEMAPGGPLTLDMRLEPAGAGLRDPQVIVEIKRAADELVCHEASTASGGPRLGDLDRPVGLRLELDRLDLVPGEYVVSAGAYPSGWDYAYDFRWDVARLRVTGPPAPGVVHSVPRWRATPG